MILRESASYSEHASEMAVRSRDCQMTRRELIRLLLRIVSYPWPRLRA
jgi:hypothetical protein